MSDIDDLQRRITAAMDRIAGSVGNAGAAQAKIAAELATALEDEKLANAQLSELKDRYDGEVSDAKAVANAEARITALDLEVQRLRTASDQLRQSNAALRAANEEGVGEPHLINASMMAELEALRAGRAVDVAEASSIISALMPLLEAPETSSKEQSDA
jgi:hypothetical protein